MYPVPSKENSCERCALKPEEELSEVSELWVPVYCTCWWQRLLWGSELRVVYDQASRGWRMSGSHAATSPIFAENAVSSYNMRPPGFPRRCGAYVVVPIIPNSWLSHYYLNPDPNPHPKRPILTRSASARDNLTKAVIGHRSPND